MMDRKQPPRLLQHLLINKQLQFSIISYSIFFAGIMSCLSMYLTYMIFEYQSMGNTGFPTFLVSGVIFLVLALSVAFGIYLTHRVAGPIHRLQMHLKEVNNGTASAPLVFRKNDFFSEILESYNEMVAKVDRKR